MLKRANLSNRISRTLRHLGSTKSDSTIEYLDCSIDFFVEHIDAQFKDGMSWDNYGRDLERDCWEIDHIVPVNCDNPTVEEVIKRLHFSRCGRSTIGVRVTVLLVKIENQTVYGYRIGGKHNTTAFLV